MASTSSPRSELAGKLELMHFIQRLKTTKRTGWVNAGCRNVESIADHMYRMGMLALLSDRTDLDINKCVCLALVHDLAEAEVGDITPHDGISDAEKERREVVAMERFLTEMLPADSPASQRIRSLWREYEDRQTAEAKFVKDLDLFELGLQGVEYEQQQEMQLQEFFESTQPRIKTDEVKSWSHELMDERRQHWQGKSDTSGYTHVEIGQ